jgi:hypothetical protein
MTPLELPPESVRREIDRRWAFVVADRELCRALQTVVELYSFGDGIAAACSCMIFEFYCAMRDLAESRFEAAAWAAASERAARRTTSEQCRTNREHRTAARAVFRGMIFKLVRDRAPDIMTRLESSGRG